MIINNGCTTLSTQKIGNHWQEELSLEDMHRLCLSERYRRPCLFDWITTHLVVTPEEASELVTMDAGIVNIKPTLVSEEDL